MLDCSRFVFGLFDVTYLIQNKLQINLDKLDVVYILLHSTYVQNLPLHLYLSAASRPVKTGQHHTSQSPLIFPLMYSEKIKLHYLFYYILLARAGGSSIQSTAIPAPIHGNSFYSISFNSIIFNFPSNFFNLYYTIYPTRSKLLRHTTYTFTL